LKKKQKLQKACFDNIKRHRFALITRRAQDLPNDDPRRMAFFGRFGDKCVRQLLLGFTNPLVPLQSEEFRVAVQRSFGLPLAVLKTHVGKEIRNHENMPKVNVDQYGNALTVVTGAKGDATRTLHAGFLAALAHSPDTHLERQVSSSKAAGAQTVLLVASFRTL